MSQQTSSPETAPGASSASGGISQSWTSPVYRVPPHQHSMPLHHFPIDTLGSNANGSSSFVPSPIAGPSRSAPPPAIQPIPAPRPKVAYEAPVFQTFQDRKRAKEAARIALHSTPALPQQSVPPPPPIQSITPSTSSPSIPPSPSAIAMMGQPGIPSPIAPPRSPTSSPLPHIPPDRSRPRSPLPTPPQSSILPTVEASQAEQVQALLDRSDTISSVKSLDRLGFTNGRRPLPKTPVGVNASRSLDRGLPKGMGDRIGGRKQPSVVLEEDEQSSPMRTPSIIFPPATGGGILVPSISLSPTPSQPSLPNVTIDTVDGTSTSPNGQHAGLEGSSPMEAQQSYAGPASLPVIIMSDEDDGHAKNESAGIAFSGLPTIAVTSDQNNMKQSENTPSGAIVCAGCHGPIIGRIVNAMNQRFHPQCFKCNECGELLEHVSSFEWEGKAYCHLDYHDKFAHHCYHCKTPIVDSRFVTLNDPVLGERYYHELHFFCSECGDPFLDPSKSSAPGTEGLGNDEESETNPFVIQRGHPYCERCHIRLHKPRCKACRQPIPDVAVQAMGVKWHQECFVCSECNQAFANSLFFPNDGKALCTVCWDQVSQSQS